MSTTDTEVKPEMRRHLVVTMDAANNQQTVDALMALALHLETYGDPPEGKGVLNLNGVGSSDGHAFTYEYTTSNNEETT